MLNKFVFNEMPVTKEELFMKYLIFIVAVSIALTFEMIRRYRSNYKHNKIKLSLIIMAYLFFLIVFSQFTMIHNSDHKFELLRNILGALLLLNLIIYLIMNLRKAIKDNKKQSSKRNL